MPTFEVHSARGIYSEKSSDGNTYAKVRLEVFDLETNEMKQVDLVFGDLNVAQEVQTYWEGAIGVFQITQ